MRRVGPLLSLIFVLLAAAAPARADQAEVLFDPHSVATIDITLPPASRAALDANPDEYQQAGLSITAAGQTTGPLQVGLRLKGSVNGSFRTLDGKAGFKVKFNHVVSGQKALGLKKLTLNNMVEDPSMVHETLAYQSFRAVGVPAPRTGYAFVRVNGDAYGVYLNVETLDDVALKRLFASTGHLYEGAIGADVKPGHTGRFEIDEGDEDDTSDLDQLIGAVAGGGDFSDRVASRTDLPEMVRMWAVEKYAGQWDGYAGLFGGGVPNNYYLHSDAAGRFSMLPWGTDQAWVHNIGFDEGGLLFVRCRQDPSCEQDYEAALASVASTIQGLDLATEARTIADVLRPWQEQDPRKETTVGEAGGWVQGVVNYLEERPGEVAAWLAAPTPPLELPAEPGPDAAEPGPDAAEVSGDGSAPAVAPSASTPAVVRAKLRVGKVSRSRSVVSTRVRVPATGPVSQRMIMTVRGRNVTACAVGARRLKAGLHTLRCRLSTTARRRLRAGKVRLTVRTRLSGTPLVRTRLTLARCHGC